MTACKMEVGIDQKYPHLTHAQSGNGYGKKILQIVVTTKLYKDLHNVVPTAIHYQS